MIRKMRRFKQQLTNEECVEILKSQPRGVLSVIGDDGYPYGLPITYWYDEKANKICFHGAKSGHKIDAIKACNKVSFCVYDQGFRKDGDWALNIKSVIVFGHMTFTEDPERIREICINMAKKFTDDTAYMEHEMKHSAPHVLCMELTPDLITGKIVNEK